MLILNKLLKDRTVFITGASRGIGRATTLLFAKHGAKLAINSRHKEMLESVANEIVQSGYHPPLIFSYDVSNISSVKETFRSLYKEWGRLDVMVNNAGMLEDRLIGMVNGEVIQKIFDTNFNGLFYHIQYASRKMMQQGSGSIINISSIIGRFGNEGQVIYGASKSAVIGATLSAAKELAQYNIRVNTIAPGFIDTDMVKQLPQDKFEKIKNSIKMKRLGHPEEVAQAILFLASDMSSYITGQVLGVDGGMVI